MTIAQIQLRQQGDSAEILIYDVIGGEYWGEGVTAKKFVEQLAVSKNVKHISVRINSPGGNVFDALAIYNALKRHPAEVAVAIDGMALSAASFIAMAGDTISIAENAMLMIHNPSTVVAGDADEMRKAAELLANMAGTLAETYAGRSQHDKDQYLAWMAAETWFDAEAAVEAGLADSITEQLAVAARCDLSKISNFQKAPAAWLAQLKSAAPPPADPPGDPPVSEPLPATYAELEAAFPAADAQFICGQLKAKATLPQAQVAFTKALQAKIDAIEAENKTLKAQKPEPAPGLAPVGGHDKTKNGGAPAGDDLDPAAAWDAAVAAKRQAGHSPERAVAAANREHPGLREQMLAAVNARK